MTAADRQPWTSSTLYSALTVKYPAPEWLLLPQVRSDAGFGTTMHPVRTADAIAMNTWPSRGLTVLGFEIKVSRSDWLRELKQLDKADPIIRFCDRWFIVAPAGIVKDAELPAAWGLITPHGKGLRIVSDGERLPAEPLDRGFVAAMFRRAMDVRPDTAQLKAEYERGAAAAREHNLSPNGEAELHHLRRELERVQANCAAFEQASGVRITGYQGGRIGDAVKEVLGGRVEKLRAELEALAPKARLIADQLEAELGSPRPTLSIHTGGGPPTRQTKRKVQT